VSSLKLSIVVCSYNQAAFIRETLNSLIDQQNVKPGELELIVIDGGSSDGSIEIIESYKDKLSYFLSEPDRGQTHALNKGFAVATGDILGWLCSDDLLHPGAVRFVVDYFRGHPEVDFIYGDAKIIDQKGELLRIKKETPFNWFIWVYGEHNFIPQASAFWRRSLHEQVKGLDETFNLDMDGDLWARFSERTRLCHVSKVLSTVRIYPETKSQRMRTRAIEEHRRICRRYGVDHSETQARVLKLAARLCRVGWKVTKGCYW
jgi:glycosyltransferase involved in cell wall biosynthesis